MEYSPSPLIRTGSDTFMPVIFTLFDTIVVPRSTLLRSLNLKGLAIASTPVMAMLHAGKDGAFAWLLTLLTAPDGSPRAVAYFWVTGVLSAFLDNAPTYLVFFELAGGDARELMGPLAGTLAAISMGAVYMGAITYIGNAPNFMIYAIAVERGVKMPSFFGYLLWASVVLLPVFGVLTFVLLARGT